MPAFQFLTRLLVAAIVATVLGFALLSFQVASNEAVVLTRFGSPVRTLQEPGLYFKWPSPIDTVHRFDTRLAFYDTRVSEALTQDKRNVILPAWIAWRVAEPLKFLQALGSPEAAPSKLDSLATSARNALLGGYDFEKLVSTDPAQLKLAEFEQRLTETIRPQALAAFGIAIEQVGLKRIALPEANTVYVFERMKAERGQYAARYRAEAEAARLYAEAHAQDPDFYRFVRELETLRKAAKDNTTLILDTDTAPFSQLKSAPPRPSGSPRAAEPQPAPQLPAPAAQ